MEELYTQREFDDKVKEMLAESEIKIAKQRDKISELKGEIIRLQKQLDETDKHEVDVATAIEKYQKRNKYLENIVNVRLALEIENLEDFFESIKGKEELEDEDLVKLEDIIESIKSFSQDVTQTPDLDAQEKAEDISNDEKKLEERYLKLLSLYEYTKVSLGERKRGRPRKEEDTIETFLKHKKEQKEKEKKEALFDFEEALNPTDSLEKIMKDLLKDN
ncbi:MAG: hypothetical protein IJS68_02320 [Clostridia bacterium]|nr:hypothetical protein [Clostridia bacterium]